MNLNLEFIRRMAHDPLHNYIVPGLTSSLIGEKSAAGCVRLFECSRDHEEPIVPHSHRFDFHCVVLAGAVRNIRWSVDRVGNADQYAKRPIIYNGAPGDYLPEGEAEVRRYAREEFRFAAGQTYGMLHDEIHSIFFERGTAVLFFEGPEVTKTTYVLEPWVDRAVVPTFEVRPWMFRRELPSQC